MKTTQRHRRRLMRAGSSLVAAALCLIAGVSCRQSTNQAGVADSTRIERDQGRLSEARTELQSRVASQLEHGLDVSDHSGAVDWVALRRQGHSFAFVKATEGKDLKDTAFDRHWKQMKAAGMVRGAYHFFVTEDDPVAQAQFFVDTVDLEPGDLAPVVDIELVGHGTQDSDVVANLHTWLDIVESRYRIKPIIYTTREFWDEHMGEGFGGYPLWVAEYDVDEPQLPLGWKTWHLWQWREDAPIEGVEKGADLSRLNLREEDLESLIVTE